MAKQQNLNNFRVLKAKPKEEIKKSVHLMVQNQEKLEKLDFHTLKLVLLCKTWEVLWNKNKNKISNETIFICQRYISVLLNDEVGIEIWH